ncbi:FAD-dependent oxidoreductase [Pseudolysobacter antarcticus]|uniref:FAD-dependent oxidoreductase n=1 Tax=Pseudolysobacter antarcticus TaxID=2511995 RepID=A0A411HKD0_9GAMM|nr:FAD-dependent oxidoreductase [Pseudolysobacter antarcticus]QBB70948.1 FAD-dependent oxidoreductase [Pseudolysobacter antarcticus]
MNEKKFDVVILGGGVIGLACALYLLKAGRSVLVIEQGTPGCGSSHGNCGTITPSHATPLAMPGLTSTALRWMLQADAPLYIKPRFDLALLSWLLKFRQHCNWGDFRRITAIKAPLLMRSRELLEQLVVDENLACEFEKTGTMYVYRDEQALEKSQWLPQALSDVGVPIETIDGARARAIEPALNNSIVGGYLNPVDAHLRPDRYLAELTRCVLEHGGEIRDGTRISGFRSGTRHIDAVLTDRGEVCGREIILALGAWSPQFAKQLNLRLPIQPGKGYSVTYDRPEICPRIPLTLKERSICVTGWSSGYRLGSTMEFSGYDTQLNRTRLDALARGAAEYLHEPVGARISEEWYGWRPMTYDDLPILGRSLAHDNLTLATGHGMLGVTMSAVTGVLISELLCGQSPSLDLAPYSPARFK